MSAGRCGVIERLVERERVVLLRENAVGDEGAVNRLATANEAAIKGCRHLVGRSEAVLHPLLHASRDDGGEAGRDVCAHLLGRGVAHVGGRCVEVAGDADRRGHGGRGVEGQLARGEVE